MKFWIAAGVIAALGLGGCQKKAETPAGTASTSRAPHGKGRYIGVGIYAPSQMWEQIVVADADAPKDPAAALPAEDDEIIVVLDSNTGDLRQCGNLSGACIVMNPWAKPVAISHAAPVLLGKHAAQLDEEAEAAAKVAETKARNWLRTK